MENNYVPTVIVVGDVDEFINRIGNRPVKIVGIVSFFGEIDGQEYSLIKYQTFLLNGKITEMETLIQMADNAEFDYIVFMNYFDFEPHSIYLANNVIHLSQIFMIDTFLQNENNQFYSIFNETLLFKLSFQENFHSILDMDLFFLNGKIHVNPDMSYKLCIEGIDNPDNIYRHFPIFANLYDRLYDSLEDCSLRHYDVILLSAERDERELTLKINETAHMTEKFIIFVHKRSKLNDVLESKLIHKDFSKLSYVIAMNGKYYILSRGQSQDTGIYMVTHKIHSISNLPTDYTVIHAGHALKEDLGYQGDDTGQSISNLNPYLNEMTAAYWIWKNTSHDYVGLVHYRRFFTFDEDKTFSEEKIITGEQARELLKKYDILVAKEEYHIFNLYSFLLRDVGRDITLLAIHLTRTMIERHQPKYLEMFNYVIESNSLYKCNMLITRKYVYDSYCEWLFSFILEAEQEFEKLVPLDELDAVQKRVFGFIAERMLTVWLMNNRLKIKELAIMEKK